MPSQIRSFYLLQLPQLLITLSTKNQLYFQSLKLQNPKKEQVPFFQSPNLIFHNMHISQDERKLFLSVQDARQNESEKTAFFCKVFDLETFEWLYNLKSLWGAKYIKSISSCFNAMFVCGIGLINNERKHILCFEYNQEKKQYDHLFTESLDVYLPKASHLNCVEYVPSKNMVILGTDANQLLFLTRSQKKQKLYFFKDFKSDTFESIKNPFITIKRTFNEAYVIACQQLNNIYFFDIQNEEKITIVQCIESINYHLCVELSAKGNGLWVGALGLDDLKQYKWDASSIINEVYRSFPTQTKMDMIWRCNQVSKKEKSKLFFGELESPEIDHMRREFELRGYGNSKEVENFEENRRFELLQGNYSLRNENMFLKNKLSRIGLSCESIGESLKLREEYKSLLIRMKWLEDQFDLPADLMIKVKKDPVLNEAEKKEVLKEIRMMKNGMGQNGFFDDYETTSESEDDHKTIQKD